MKQMFPEERNFREALIQQLWLQEPTAAAVAYNLHQGGCGSGKESFSFPGVLEVRV